MAVSVDQLGETNAPPATSTRFRTLLGIGLIVVGLIVLADVTIPGLISALFIGVLAIIGGAMEILHAFGRKGLGRVLWYVVPGVLYVAFGIALARHPQLDTPTWTFLLGSLLVGSGIVRGFMSFAQWAEVGPGMMISGAVGILAGLVIATGFPMSGLGILGLLLGLDLIVHGLAWLAYGGMLGSTLHVPHLGKLS